MSKINTVLKDYPDITLETIEVLTNARKTLKAGIRMFPALKIGDDIISGVLLSEDKIRTFVEQHKG